MPDRPTDGRPDESLRDALRAAARRFGTPVFVTDEATLDEATAHLEAAFPDPWIRQYSVKANDVPGVIRLLADRGLGANVVSSGEWATARAAAVQNARITLEGIGKTDRDLRNAVDAAVAGSPLRWVAVESLDEAERLDELARGGGARVDVLYRLNPQVLPETLPGLAVGGATSKFGLTEEELSLAVDRVPQDRRGGGIRPRGIHLHVGSQLRAVDAWRDGARRALALLGLLRGNRDEFDTIDFGGGFPVPADGEPAPDPARFARELPALLHAVPPDRRPRRMAVEPGRRLVARAGWLVASVLHVRDRGGPMVVLDAGMTELIRPALYGAIHPIVALTLDELHAVSPPVVLPTRVEGPVCESTDHLGVHDLPPLRRGDLVAIAHAGAYAASLGSTYNGRPAPPQVVRAYDGRLSLLRPRGAGPVRARSRTLAS